MNDTYELAAATSGFLMVPKIGDLQRVRESGLYQFDEFVNPEMIREDFFSKPVSYRYVDGKNAFYCVDRSLRVHGLLRIKSPMDWSLYERNVYSHIRPAVQKLKGKAWFSHIGNNNDITIINNKNSVIRLTKGRWQFVDIAVVETVLSQSIIETHVATILRLIFTLSSMKIGALLLIKGGDECPPAAGQIDTSSIRDSVVSTLVGKNIEEIMRMNAAVGILGSDGLTTIERDGTIVSTGEIIALGSGEGASSGGGRTQAGLTASKFGLAVKVSQDGPVSFFRDGQRILHLDI